MARNLENGGGRDWSRWRIAAWTLAAIILLLPLIAMQFTDEVNWSAADFAFAGVLILGTGVAFEFVVRITDDTTYRAAVGVALAAAFILVWLSMGVGVIGADGDPANLMYFGVLAIGFIGAVLARFRPAGMARALLATAVAQTLVAVVALVAGFGSTTPNWPLDILGLTGFFAGLWIISAWLFWNAAPGGPKEGAV